MFTGVLLGQHLEVTRQTTARHHRSTWVPTFLGFSARYTTCVAWVRGFLHLERRTSKTCWRLLLREQKFDGI